MARDTASNPTEIPARANIFALKTLGVTHIVSVSAVGSLKEELHPLDMVIPDQIIDRTKSRVNSFFGGGIVAHVAFSNPFCSSLSGALYDVARETAARAHMGGSLIVMEGSLFSTRAESELYRSWGASIIGMTALPEAKLAREAEICYATLACVTDFDTWHPDHDSVSVELVCIQLVEECGGWARDSQAAHVGCAGSGAVCVPQRLAKRNHNRPGKQYPNR